MAEATTIGPVLRRRVPEADAAGLPGDLHPVLRRVYANRGIEGAEALEKGLGALYPPSALGGLDAAADRLADAVTGGERILLVGDFDADGATSCAVAIRALRAMGAEAVDYLVPNRFDYGYGLSPEIVEVARERAPHVLVTVDNGVSSIDGVAAARREGMAVIVTDHHLPGERLPDADVMVNPNLPDDRFPSKHLAGVGVIFYVMLGLRAALRERGWFGDGRPEPALAALLDLVALGTVADVVPLDRNNRILIEQGLRRIRAGRACPGIRALLTVAGREPARVVASDIGFAVGPRLNAAGRLEDMALGIECLLADDEEAALAMARELDGLNRQRRDIEGRMKDEALALMASLPERLGGEGVPDAICLADPQWHQGVVGLLASRLREHYHRPAIAFAPAGDGGELKGSARSIPGLHMRDLLERINSRFPGLIAKFGGHAMAAGLTLDGAGFEAFRAAFEAEVGATVSRDTLNGVILTDGDLEAGDLTMDAARALRHAGPWGQGFPEPLFDGRFVIRERRIVGERHLKLRLAPSAAPALVLDGIAFNGVDRGWDACTGEVTVAYRLDINEFRGREGLQLRIEHMES